MSEIQVSEAEVRPVHEKLLAIGWDPLEPSQDCLAAASRPAMPSGLSDLDRIGIHQRLLLAILHLDHFHALSPWSELTSRAVHATATILALRTAGILGASLCMPTYVEWGDRLHRWETGPLADAERRLAARLREHEWADAAEFEPASTLTRVVGSRGWVDRAKNTRLFQDGMVKSELRGATSRMRRGVEMDVRRLAMRDLDVLRALSMLTRDKPDRKLMKIRRDGTAVFDPENVRDAFEVVVGAVQPVQKDLPAARADVDEAFIAAKEEGIGTWMNHLAFRSVRQELEDERQRIPGDEPMAIVIDHLDKLTDGETSIRDLAKRHGDREKLGKAWAAVRERFRRGVSA